MTLVTTVVQLPDEPVHILIRTGLGFVIDPQVPPAGGGGPLQPMIGGRLLYLDGGKVKALPVAS